MADTVQDFSTLKSLLADNNVGNISAQDLRDMLVSIYFNESQANLENGKTTVDTPDDEFDSDTLDGKWTLVSGTVGTVSATNSTNNSAIYDLTTKPGTLLVQASNADFQIRQDYTLPDGNSMILAVTPNISLDGSTANNEQNTELVINNNDSSSVGTGRASVICNANSGTANYEVVGINQSSTTVGTNNKISVGQRMYFRIVRSSSTYYLFHSLDGDVWIPVGTSSPTSPDNVWIGVRSQTNTGNPKAITAFHWIRQGGNNLDPW